MNEREFFDKLFDKLSSLPEREWDTDDIIENSPYNGIFLFVLFISFFGILVIYAFVSYFLGKL